MRNREKPRFCPVFHGFAGLRFQNRQKSQTVMLGFSRFLTVLPVLKPAKPDSHGFAGLRFQTVNWQNRQNRGFAGLRFQITTKMPFAGQNYYFLTK